MASGRSFVIDPFDGAAQEGLGCGHLEAFGEDDFPGLHHLEGIIRDRDDAAKPKEATLGILPGPIEGQ